jgi:excisionase family DNA binding protein
MSYEIHYLSVGELSDYLKLSKSTIYKKTSSRLIPFLKSGKKLLFDKEAIDEWLKQYTQETVRELQKNLIGILKPTKIHL